MNSVSFEQIMAVEVDILNNVEWDLQFIICPLEISLDIIFVLDLNILNIIKGCIAFCENISNFIIWATWDHYSQFAISVTSIIIFCEITDAYTDIRKILSYINLLSDKMKINLLSEVWQTRKFVLSRIGSITEDINLINRVGGISRITSLEVYLEL